MSLRSRSLQGRIRGCSVLAPKPVPIFGSNYPGLAAQASVDRQCPFLAPHFRANPLSFRGSICTSLHAQAVLGASTRANHVLCLRHSRHLVCRSSFSLGPCLHHRWTMHSTQPHGFRRLDLSQLFRRANYLHQRSELGLCLTLRTRRMVSNLWNRLLAG